jgi:hypothetical protein
MAYVPRRHAATDAWLPEKNCGAPSQREGAPNIPPGMEATTARLTSAVVLPQTTPEKKSCAVVQK